MSMNKNMFRMAIAGAFVIAFVASTFAAESKKTMNPDAKAKLLAAAKARRTGTGGGGLVYSPIRGKILEVVNRQNDIPASVIESELREIELSTKMPIRLVAERSPKAGVALELIDTPNDPSIVMTMDEGWAKLNVRKLHEGNVDMVSVTNRFHKQIWRGIGAALGVGVSPFQPCLMRNIGNMNELDRCPMTTPCPASLSSIQESSQYWGIAPLRIMSYRMACQEGWAPAPTNDVQKAIWDKVHATPTNPIIIKPETTKQN